MHGLFDLKNVIIPFKIKIKDKPYIAFLLNIFNIPLLFNLYTPLIELSNIPYKHQIKKHRCKLKKKKTYSKL